MQTAGSVENANLECEHTIAEVYLQQQQLLRKPRVLHPATCYQKPGPYLDQIWDAEATAERSRSQEDGCSTIDFSSSHFTRSLDHWARWPHLGPLYRSFILSNLFISCLQAVLESLRFHRLKLAGQSCDRLGFICPVLCFAWVICFLALVKCRVPIQHTIFTVKVHSMLRITHFGICIVWLATTFSTPKDDILFENHSEYYAWAILNGAFWIWRAITVIYEMN